MVRLVVDHDELTAPRPAPDELIETTADTTHHVFIALPVVGAEDLLGELRRTHPRVQDKLVVVDYFDVGQLEIAEHLAGHEMECAIVAIVVPRSEDLQTVPYGDARCDQQEVSAEPLVSRSRRSVECLPGDKHGHNESLPAAGRDLHGGPGEPIIELVIGVIKHLGHGEIAYSASPTA